MFSVTKYQGKKDNNTQDFYSVTWEHFINRMSNHDIRNQKDGPAFSAVQYATEVTKDFKFKEWIYYPKSNRQKGMVFINNKGETRITDLEYRITRANVNVVSVSMVVMDFDQGSIADIHEKLKEVNHLIYTTFSHSLRVAKFRLIIPLKTPVPVSQYREVWEQVNILTGGIADQSCKDPARLHFLPSCPPETAGDRYAQGFSDKKYFQPKIAEITKTKKNRSL